MYNYFWGAKLLKILHIDVFITHFASNDTQHFAGKCRNVACRRLLKKKNKKEKYKKKQV
jgi:hypothetical protein